MQQLLPVVAILHKQCSCVCSQDVTVLLPFLPLAFVPMCLAYLLSVDVLCPSHCFRRCSGSLQFANLQEAVEGTYICLFVDIFIAFIFNINFGFIFIFILLVLFPLLHLASD